MEDNGKEDYKGGLLFFLNSKKVVLHDAQPETTLLQFLRSSGIGLTGTKLGCGEGGCGACTVMLSHYEPQTKTIVHRAVNACLYLLCAVDGMAVTTVEGLGSVINGVHPVQERIAQANGSQCGFCTPGIVMALYAFLRSHPNATQLEIEESFDGNLCRCTGYRPLLDAAKTFGAGCGIEGCCQLQKPAAGNETSDCGGGSCAGKKITELPLDLKKEPIFPPFLMSYVPTAQRIQGERICWFRPLTLPGLLQLRKTYPDSRLVVGNTEIGIEVKFKNAVYPTYISPTQVPELNVVTVGSDGVEIGSSITLSKVAEILRGLVASRPEHETQTFRAILSQLKYFAGNQIRNAASIAGNIVTASPISDLNPVLFATGCILTIASLEGVRKVPVSQFFLKYRVVDLKPGEVVVSVHIPFTKPLEFVEAFKQARRKDDDIAIVSCCFRLQLEKVPDQPAEKPLYKVALADFGYGGMSVKVVPATKTQQFLSGRVWDKSMFPQIYDLLGEDLPLAAGAPGGMIEYRRTLTTSFFFKFYLGVIDKLYANAVASEENDISYRVPEKYRTAIERHHKALSHGEQRYQTKPEMAPVSQPIIHQSALKQVTGEAAYTDDIPNPVGGLYAAFVLATKAHARIKKVDPARALAARGVVAFFGPKDIPGENQVGPVFHDEELFASEEVLFMGHPLGIVVADTQQNAVEASRLVDVEYEELPAVLTIKQAIEQNSYLNMHHIISRGNVEEGFAAADHIIEGEMQVGGQEHFYLETQGSVVVPGEGSEYTIFASTQNPTKTQNLVAKCLGVGSNQVVVKIKRMGGGFGGKETRSIFVSCAAAVASYKLRKPVRLVLDRDVDMVTSGFRHPFLGKYRVGFTKEGKILALDTQLYADAGYSFDLSGGVLDRAIFHSENAYYIPHVHVSGKLCKTNLPTNTAFRGFGGPQGMIICESWIEKVAHTLGVSADHIRELNFYKDGQTTPYHQLIKDSRMERIWNELQASSDYVKRKEEVAKYNAQSRYKKRGIALIPTKFGMSFTIKSLNQAGALVHVYTDGTVLVTHGGTEMGQGLHTKMVQIAAKEFGIPIENVHVAETSTDKVANTAPTAASVSSDMNGMAVLDACKQITERLAPYREKNPKASFKELALIAHFDRVNLSANGFYKTPDVGYIFEPSGTGIGTPFNYFNYGAAISEVEVDCLTGDYHIVRTDILMDVGDSLNPTIDIGQIEGAFVQGVGWCTLEELVTFNNGYLFTRGPSTYKIPSFNDVPQDFRVSLLSDAPNVRAIHSSKGVGEPPLFLSASVFFAIQGAVSAARKDQGFNEFHPLDSPATCERIRIACEDKFTSQFTKPKQQTN